MHLLETGPAGRWGPFVRHKKVTDYAQQTLTTDRGETRADQKRKEWNHACALWDPAYKRRFAHAIPSHNSEQQSAHRLSTNKSIELSSSKPRNKQAQRPQKCTHKEHNHYHALCSVHTSPASMAPEELHSLRVRANFRAGDEDSNFSVFRVRRFSEWPAPLH